MSTKVLDVVEAGVVTGDALQKLFKIAKDEGFALPAAQGASGFLPRPLRRRRRSRHDDQTPRVAGATRRG